MFQSYHSQTRHTKNKGGNLKNLGVQKHKMSKASKHKKTRSLKGTSEGGNANSRPNGNAHPRRLLIVDGYNVLRSGARYQNMRLTTPDYEDDFYNQARERLINDVASFAGTEYRATVVFDAADNAFSTGTQQRIGGVRVVFSPAGKSADEIIEKLAHEARKKDLEVLVVSSDASIQETVFAGRVTRMSAAEFSYNLNSFGDVDALEHKSAPSPAAGGSAQKMTLAERLPKDKLAALTRLRDGK